MSGLSSQHQARFQT